MSERMQAALRAAGGAGGADGAGRTAGAGGAPVAVGAWQPPSVAGPLVTFRGKPTAASSLEDEVRAARAEGYERGRSEGLAAAAAEIAARLQDLDARRALLDTMARQMSAPLERCDSETAAELARIAVLVGAQLARRELALEPRQVIAVVRESLAALPASAREVRIHLHPRDAALLRESLDDAAGPAAWTVVEDPVMSRGGCRIETEASRVDARLEQRVAAAMASVLGDERGDPRGVELPPAPVVVPPVVAPPVVARSGPADATPKPAAKASRPSRRGA